MTVPEVPFTVDADLDLDEAAAPWLRPGCADVVIRRGAVPESLPEVEHGGRFWSAAQGRFLVNAPHGLRILVEGGARIQRPVDRKAGDGKVHALPRRRWPHVSASLKALYVLKREQRRAFEQGLCTVERLSGVQALNALFRAVFRPRFAVAILGRGQLFQQLAVLQSQVGVFRFHRPFTHEWFDRGVACIAEALPARPLPAVGCA